MIQDAVRGLCEIGKRLTDDLDAERLQAATKRLDALIHPLSSDDIRALISQLPEEGDTAFGLNWTIVHAVEAAPDWPLWDALKDERSHWVRVLRLRLANEGIHDPSKNDPGSI